MYYLLTFGLTTYIRNIFQTILELSAKNDSPMYMAMKRKKKVHGKTVQKARDNKKLKVLIWHYLHNSFF